MITFKKYRYLLLLALCLTGCIKEEYHNIYNKNENTTLNFVLENEITRSNGTVANYEDIIQKLDIFIYQGSLLKWYIPNNKMHKNENTVSIPIPTEKKENLFDKNIDYDIYIIANYNDIFTLSEDEHNLNTLKNITMNTDFANKPSNFLMTAKITNKLRYSQRNLGDILLKRAATKIVLKFKTNISGYSIIGTPTARLENYVKKTYLLEDNTIQLNKTDFGITDYKAINKTTPDNWKSTLYPFYTYTNDWSSDESTKTSLLIKLKAKTGGVQKDFYYTTNVNFENLSNPTDYKKTKRNNSYTIELTINKIGSEDEGNPTDINESNYFVKDWKTNSVDINIQELNYLLAQTRYIELTNSTAYKLNFSSSVYPVEVKNVIATYTTSGADPVNINIPANTILVDNENSQIKINSSIPTNGVPKDIEFTISNGFTSLDLKIKVRQTAEVYITDEQGSSSSMNPNGNLSGDLDNKSMYIVTSISSGEDVVVGFPPLDENGYTVDSEEVSNMLSPRFQMASQLGATYTQNYASAKRQCKKYWEVHNGVRYDDWRLPTEAELRLVDKMQNIDGAVVTSILTGAYYWDAYYANGAFKTTQEDSFSNSINAFVRCVRDIKN